MNSRFFRSFLALAFLLLGSISIAFAQLASPGLPSPQAAIGDTIGFVQQHIERGQTQSPAAPQMQSNFSGSVPGKFVPGVLPITLEGAIERGLKQNLGALLSSQDVQVAHGTRWQQLSALLPHVTRAPANRRVANKPEGIRLYLQYSGTECSEYRRTFFIFRCTRLLGPAAIRLESDQQNAVRRREPEIRGV